MSKRRQRIAIFGWFGGGNLGNDGTIASFIGFLREAKLDAEITIICPGPDVMAKVHNVPTLQLQLKPTGFLLLLDKILLRVPSAIVNWAVSLQVMGRFDYLVFPGTGAFEDALTGVLGRPSVTLRWCLSARLRGAKVIFALAGADIRHPLSRVVLKWAAQTANYRSYRDPVSLEFMKKLGVDESKSVAYTDIVFRNAPLPRTERSSGEPLTVGLGVMSYRGWAYYGAVGITEGQTIHAEYLAKMGAFVDWLLANGYRVRYLIGEASDERAVRHMETLPNASHPNRLPTLPMQTLDDVMAQMASTDVVIGTRYHTMICGLDNYRPGIALSYAPKCQALMASVNMTEFVLDAEKLTLDELKALFLKVAANLEGYERELKVSVSKLRDRLAEQETILKERVFRN